MVRMVLPRLADWISTELGKLALPDFVTSTFKERLSVS